MLHSTLTLSINYKQHLIKLSVQVSFNTMLNVIVLNVIVLSVAFRWSRRSIMLLENIYNTDITHQC